MARPALYNTKSWESPSLRTGLSCTLHAALCSIVCGGGGRVQMTLQYLHSSVITRSLCSQDCATPTKHRSPLSRALSSNVIISNTITYSVDIELDLHEMNLHSSSSSSRDRMTEFVWASERDDVKKINPLGVVVL